MNIIEAYIKYKGQLIILISGLPACGKLNLAKTIHKDFNLKLINQFDYYKKGYNKTITLHDGTTLINWYTDDAVDWEKLNKDIDENKDNGIIVVGFSLPADKITSNVDFHIHLNISKQACMDKRKAHVEKHKDKHPQEYKILGTPLEKLKMNKLIFPYYLESVKKSKIQKFINMMDKSDAEIYDIAFNYIIDFIEDYLYPDSTQSNTTEKTPKVTKITKKPYTQTEPESISMTGELLDKPEYLYDKELDMVTELSDPEDYDAEKGEGPIAFVDEEELEQLDLE